MNSVTCIIHHGEVDDTNVVPLPDGPVCVPCYAWMESLLEGDELDDDTEWELVYVNLDEEEDDHEDYEEDDE